MCSKDPEPIMFSPESLDSGMLGQVPHMHSFVFSARYNQFMLGMEQSIGHVIEVSSTRIDFPGLCFAHSPYFNRPIIGSRDDQWETWVERCKVDPSVVALQDVLDCQERVECLKVT